MSNIESVDDVCSLCRSHFTSCALNKLEKNKRRPVEKQTLHIYRIVKLVKGDSDTGITCTYCRDVLRKIFKKHSFDKDQLDQELEEAVLDGSLFPRRNLKRKGLTMSGREKKKTQMGQSSKNLHDACTQPSATGSLLTQSVQTTQMVQMEEYSTQPTISQEDFYSDGVVNIDEGIIRQVSLGLTPKRRSQEQNNKDVGGIKKQKVVAVVSNNLDNENEQQTLNPIAETEVTSNSVANETLMMKRLRQLHDETGAVKHSSIVRNERWTQPLIISEILSLWKIAKRPVTIDYDIFSEQPEKGNAFRLLIDFLNTGRRIPTDGLDVIPELIKGNFVNNYVLGLFIIHAFRCVPLNFSQRFMESLCGVGASTSFAKLVPNIISVIQQRQQFGDFVMNMYETITSNEEMYEEKFLLDGDNSLSGLKQYFYYWLYHQVAMNPEASATELLIARLKMQIGNAVECDDTIPLHYYDPSTSAMVNVRIHSLVLMVLQQTGPEKFMNDKLDVVSAFGSLKLKRSSVTTLVKMLYKPDPVKEHSNPQLEQIQPTEVAEFLIALRIARPFELFYSNCSPSSPYKMKLCLMFFNHSLDVKYLCGMERKPFEFLSIENAAMMDPQELKELFKSDKVALDEKQLYDFIVSFSKTIGKSARKIRQTESILLPFVRYPLMSKEEFGNVAKDGRLSESEVNIFWLHITSDIKPSIPIKFWRSLTVRNKY